MSHNAEHLLGAYALGALDAEDLELVQHHLEGCTRCQELLAAYEHVAQGLLHLSASRAPAPVLRTQLGAAVASAKVQRQDARLKPESVIPGKAAALIRWPRTAWAGLGLALVAVNLYLFAQLRMLSARADQLLAQQQANQTALAVLSYPTSRVANLEQDLLRGSFVYDEQIPLAVLNVWGLPPLSDQQTYQLWLIQHDGSRASGGLLTPTQENQFVSLVVWSPVAFEAVQGIGITVEPAGGSSSPTGPRVLGTDLVHSP